MLSNRTTTALIVSALLTTTTTDANATAAIFFPKGSSSKVERYHLSVALSGTQTVAWESVDISGGTQDVGVVVAVKASGRVEVSARVWLDVIEEATRVKVTAIGNCKPIGGQGSVVITGEGGISVVGSSSSSSSSGGGCNGGSSSAKADGGGGCTSNSSPSSGGCGGCGSCEPSEHGHPGCSAIGMQEGCGPLDLKAGTSSSGGSSSGSSGGGVDSGDNLPRVGPYETVKVRASDGSARAWLDGFGYDVPDSFAGGAAALEAAGYELIAVRARAPASPSLVQSLRVVTTSPSSGGSGGEKNASIPLRLLRMGSGASSAPPTPLTLVVVANAPQKLGDLNLFRIDENMLLSLGGSSNYETLLNAALQGTAAPPSDASDDSGAPASSSTSRWVVESSRSISNRITPKNADASTEPTIADIFHDRCGDRGSSRHSICGNAAPPPVDAGEDPDSGTVVDPDGGEAGASDAGAPVDDAGGGGGGDDAGPTDPDSGADCVDTTKASCDDLDLAVSSNSSAIATRFRGLVSGDAVDIADLTFAASTDPLPTGNYFVRVDGVAGLCEPPAGSNGGSGSADLNAEGEGEVGCKQAVTRTRTLASMINFGPIVMILVVIRAVTTIMRRSRRKR